MLGFGSATSASTGRKQGGFPLFHLVFSPDPGLQPATCKPQPALPWPFPVPDHSLFPAFCSFHFQGNWKCSSVTVKSRAGLFGGGEWLVRGINQAPSLFTGSGGLQVCATLGWRVQRVPVTFNQARGPLRCRERKRMLGLSWRLFNNEFSCLTTRNAHDILLCSLCKQVIKGR